MTRAWWLALLLAPGGLVAVPVLWLALRLRERNRVVRYVGEPIQTIDLTGIRRAPRSPEDRS